MEMNEYSKFPEGASPSDGLKAYPRHSFGGGVLALCEDTVSVFYSSSQLGYIRIR